MYDIMQGIDIIIASIKPALAAASPKAGTAGPGMDDHPKDQQIIDVPIRIAVYLTNAGIILPASSKWVLALLVLFSLSVSSKVCFEEHTLLLHTPIACRLCCSVRIQPE